MNIHPVVAVLRTYWRVIAITLIVTVGTAILFTVRQPETYSASTSLIVDFQTENPFDRGAIPAQLNGSYMATQVDIIASERVAQQVAADLNLYIDDAGRLEVTAADVTPSRAQRNAAAERLMQDVEVSLGDDNSRVITIAYEATDPEMTARIANQFATSYIQAGLDLSRGPSRKNAEWFDEQTEELRQRLETAEARLTTFQQENGIVSLDDRLDTETARLTDLSSSLVEAQSQLYDVQARQLGRNHPEYQRVVERERTLTNTVEEQKQRILALKEQRDRLGALAREVENERRNYESTLQSYYQVRMESQFKQTNISVLSPAIPPSSPSGPTLVLNVVSAALLGLLLPIALIVLVEMLNRRIRTREDVQQLLGVRVLETI